MHLPGVALIGDALTEKDLADLRLGLQLGVDYVALSFIRSAEDVGHLKQHIREQGARAPVIAKLEKQQAIDALDGILGVADGVMVSRGDLGLELPLERVPLLQKEIIRRANERGTLAITATQMVESMVHSPRPTRAEVSDVANAVLDGTDALLLSSETAIGQYPPEVVEMVARIVQEVEQQPAGRHAERRRLTRPHAMSSAACGLASEVRARALLVFTRSGYSARLVAKERPTVPIFAFTPGDNVSRPLALWWGITPLRLKFAPSAEETIAQAERLLLQRHFLRKGDIVVIARWSRVAARGWTNFVRLVRLGTLS